MAREKIVPLTFEQFMATLGWDMGRPQFYKIGKGKILARGTDGKIWSRDASKFDHTKGWTSELIEKLLQNNPCACERALLVLWQAQTSQERARGETFVSNDVGFTGADAPRMTELAQQVLAGLPLGIAQLRWLRQRAPRSKFSRLGKYHAQLIAAIGAKE